MSLIEKFFILLLQLIIFLIFNISIQFDGKNKIKEIKCPCKYKGPCILKFIDIEGKPVENAMVIFWFSIKIEKEDNKYYEKILEVHKKQTNSEGEVMVPDYKGEKKGIVCCPRFFAYKENWCTYGLFLEIKNGNFNYFEEIRCSKKGKKIIFHLIRIEDEYQKYIEEIYIKNLPIEVKEKIL